MHYKIMMIVFLIPVVSYGTEDTTIRDARIAELESIKSDIEFDAVKLSSRIYEEKKQLTDYTRGMLELYTGPISDKKAFMPKEFEAFVSRISYVFDAGRDITPYIERAFSKEVGADIHMMCVRMIIQKLVVDKMINQYRDKVKKLETVNKELWELKA